MMECKGGDRNEEGEECIEVQKRKGLEITRLYKDQKPN